MRVLETSHPPGWYIPPEGVRMGLLLCTAYHTVCECKGRASYDRLASDRTGRAEMAWSYPDPQPGYAPIKDHLAFYPGRGGW